ncbi:MAG: hypothetical protein AB2693_27300 [Candidatus Thiodiazotropha sp.]
MSDEDLVINYCLQSKVTKPAVDELLKRGFNSLEALSLVDMEDLMSPKIPCGQRRLILHVAGTLKQKPVTDHSNSGAGVNGGTANETVSGGTTTRLPTENSEPSRAATAEVTGATRNGVPGISQTPTNGAHHSGTNNNDLFQHVNGLLQEQQRLTSTSFASSSPSQVSWNDPQIHLSAAAGKSTSNYLDICDFAQTGVEEEVVLGNQGDQQIIVKSGPKKPRLENLTLCQWSVANLAILYKLVGENKLQGPSLMDYLSYTTKVYQLVQRYSLVSVMLYDREYRKLQASLSFRWGTDVQHLSNIHLQARDKPVAQGSQQKKVPALFKVNKNGPTKTEICRNFNSQKGCSFADCKFKHICIIPGCKQGHSALTHNQTK